MVNLIEICQVKKCVKPATEKYVVNLGLEKEVWVIVGCCKKHFKEFA